MQETLYSRLIKLERMMKRESESMAPTICSLIGEVTITSINGDFIREVMFTSINATICSLILVTLILVNFF